MDRLLAQGIVIRAFEPRDVPAFAEAARESHATVGRWLSWCHGGYSEAEAESWFAQTSKALAEGTAYELGIFTSDDDVFLGGVGLNQFNRDHGFCNLGYWVRESRQRTGIATNAARALAEFGFRQLTLTRIEIVVAVGNISSQRVAVKVGGVFECVARNRLIVHAKPVAATVYSLVPEQFGAASLLLEERPSEDSPMVGMHGTTKAITYAKGMNK